MLQNSNKSFHSPISLWIVSCSLGLPYALINEIRLYFAVDEFPTSITVCFQDNILTEDTTNLSKYVFYCIGNFFGIFSL